MSDDLAVYLKGPGEIPGIGPEKGHTMPANGIVCFTSTRPCGSYRYVCYVRGVAVAALQVVALGKSHVVVANVYTRPDHRREGWATACLRCARRDFKVVEQAADKNLSEEGKAWAVSVASVARPASSPSQ